MRSRRPEVRPHRLKLCRHFQADALRLQHPGKALQILAQESLQLHGFRRELQLAAFHPRGIHQVLDHGIHPLHTALDGAYAEDALVTRVNGLQGFREQRGMPLDDPQRVAQVMGDGLQHVAHPFL